MKKLSALLLGFAGMFVLSGCSAQDRSGTFYETFVKPMDISLSKIHDYVGSWGWSIVIITLIIRIIILPFMLKNYKSQNEARRGQALARPELEVVQAKQKAAREKEARAISNEEKTQARAELMELQREQMAIMKKYNAMPLSVGGCLPLLIQMPIFVALYWAFSGNAIPADAKFLWFTLKQPDRLFMMGNFAFNLLPILNVGVTYIQQKRNIFFIIYNRRLKSLICHTRSSCIHIRICCYDISD